MGWIAALAEGRKAGGTEVKGEVVPLCSRGTVLQCSSVTAYVLLADDLQACRLLKGKSKRNYKINVMNKFSAFWEDNPK